MGQSPLVQKGFFFIFGDQHLPYYMTDEDLPGAWRPPDTKGFTGSVIVCHRADQEAAVGLAKVVLTQNARPAGRPGQGHCAANEGHAASQRLPRLALSSRGAMTRKIEADRAERPALRPRRSPPYTLAHTSGGCSTSPSRGPPRTTRAVTLSWLRARPRRTRTPSIVTRWTGARRA